MSKKYEKINATLAYLFNRTIAEDPELTEQLPEESIVVMQLEGYDSFNRWAQELALNQERGEGCPMLFAVFRMAPALSPRKITPSRLASSQVAQLELQPA